MSRRQLKRLEEQVLHLVLLRSNIISDMDTICINSFQILEMVREEKNGDGMPVFGRLIQSGERAQHSNCGSGPCLTRAWHNQNGMPVFTRLMQSSRCSPVQMTVG
jgi:hypothetical protein